jgi:hypothetical protein
MTSNNMRRALLALIACLMSLVAAAQDGTRGVFRDEAALRARHPEIARHETFYAWTRQHGVGPWHEVRDRKTEDMTVAVQARDQSGVLAALVTDRPRSNGPASIKRLEVISTAGTNRAKPEVSKFVTNKLSDAGRLHALRPVIEWSVPTAKLSWEAEFVAPGRQITFSIDGDRLSQKSIKSLVPPKSGVPAMPGAADELASNELHHLDEFRAEARAWIGSASTTQDKARRIFDEVRASYTYDSSILNISEFTWSDTLVRDTNGRKGICDEWAVVEISYLRSVGIPARLKFMAWKESTGEEIAHAALEYNDGGTWRHMDALWNAFNDASVYRRSGGANVTVMDGDDPKDARSTAPAWGVPDPSGDQKLYPYGDPVITPPYPGNPRPGYSY